MDTRARVKMPLLYLCYRLSVATALSASERCVKIIIDDSPDETILCLSHSKRLQLKADDQLSQIKKQKQNIKHSHQKKQNKTVPFWFVSALVSMTLSQIVTADKRRTSSNFVVWALHQELLRLSG